jgi:hypothetical protein
MFRRLARRWVPGLVVACLGVALGASVPSTARAQYAPTATNQSINRFFYYPYYYFPANYWPQLTARWPEPPGAPYQPPPAYMAYPPFKEPYWHYDYWEPKRFYRGFHFWLDQF